MKNELALDIFQMQNIEELLGPEVFCLLRSAPLDPPPPRLKLKTIADLPPSKHVECFYASLERELPEYGIPCESERYWPKHTTNFQSSCNHKMIPYFVIVMIS